MRRFTNVHILLLPLIIILWGTFIIFAEERKQDIVDAFTSVELGVVQETSLKCREFFSLGARSDRPAPPALEWAFVERFIKPIRLLKSGRPFLVRNGHAYYFGRGNFPKEYFGQPLKAIAHAQEKKGGRGLVSFASKIATTPKGVANLVWDPASGPEILAWATFEAGGQTWTLAIATPEEEILAFAGLDSQLRRDIIISAVLTLGLLSVMLLLMRQQKLVTRHNEELEQTVATRTQEMTSELARRRQAEQALRTSEEHYRMLVEHQSDMVLRISKTSRILFTNPSFLELFGVSEEHATNSRFLEYVLKEDRRQFWEQVVKVLDSPHTLQADMRGETDQGLRWTSWTGKALLDDEGEVKEILVIGRDITEMKQTAQRISNSLAEKELLLQEIHHRVKNNLQIICSLLDMASRRLECPADEEVFQDIHSKIEGMSLIHSQLYQSERFDSVDISQYITNLCRQLQHMFGAENATADLHMQKVSLGINRAIPCGLVLNEVLTNVFKHAYPKGRAGTFRLNLSKDGSGQVRIQIIDDGPGLPKNWEEVGSKTMGMKLMRNIIELQLGGELSITSSESGTTYDIHFSAEHRDKRGKNNGR